MGKSVWRYLRARARRLRRRGLGHQKQAGPANDPDQHAAGPYCRLPRARHPAPYAKRRVGAARRAEKLHKLQQRAALLPPDRDYDDGYFPLGT